MSIEPLNKPVGVTTDRLIECLAWFMDENGYPPSMTQLGECLGLKSKSSVAYWMARAEAEGRIERVMKGPHTKAIVIRENGED